MEVSSSEAASVVLPRPSDWLCPGVPYWVWNAGSANIDVMQQNGDSLALVRTVTAGAVGMFLWSGAGWHGQPIGSAQEGSVYPAQRLIIPIGVQAREFNTLAHIVGNNGYDGSAPIAVRVILQQTGAFGALSKDGYAFETGDSYLGVSWASGSFVMLEVEQGADIGGWGGVGGRAGVSGTGASAGADGEDGGTAVRADVPLIISCAGSILGGGGGGGGGGGSSSNATILGGGGGGGRGYNMDFNGQFIGSPGGAATPPAGEGGDGGPFVTGLGGLGVKGGGNGGAGGSAAAAGTAGASGVAAGGSGGAAGLAISYSAAAGAPTILSGGSNIIGSSAEEG